MQVAKLARAFAVVLLACSTSTVSRTTTTMPATTAAARRSLPTFPESPFASAKVGDWWLVQSGGESGTSTVEWYVAKADGDTLTIAHRTVSSTSYARPPPGTGTASKTAPSLALYDLHPDAQAAVVRGTCDALGRSVPCATITYRDGSASYTIHTSPAVKGGLIDYATAAGLGSNGGSLLGFGAGLDSSLADPYRAPSFTVEAGTSGGSMAP
jgi:hypothetical protein